MCQALVYTGEQTDIIPVLIEFTVYVVPSLLGISCISPNGNPLRIQTTSSPSDSPEPLAELLAESWHPVKIC